MKIYLCLAPAKAQTDEFQNWLAVLPEMDHLDKYSITTEGKNQGLQTHIEKLQSSLGKVQEVNKSLRDEVVSLKEMNNRMGEVIERLQSPDRQMEEKRRLIK